MSLRAKASAALDEQEMERLARALVRTRSVTGNEGQAAKLLGDWLEQAGLAVRYADVRPGQPNLIATLPGTGGGLTIMLCGHTDTVPAGEGWTRDPFGAEVVEGRLYGRGSCDMKAGLAAMAAAVVALARAGERCRGTVIFAAVVDEEEGQTGARALVASGVRADGAIIGEPTKLRVVTAHKGLLDIAIRTHGVAAHASAPHKGASAIDAMRRVLDELDGYAAELATYPSHPACGGPSLLTGTIEGGVISCMVPALCEIGVDRRLAPGEDPNAVVERMREVVARAGVRWELAVKNTCLPIDTDPATPVAAALLRNAMAAAGHPVGPDGWPAVSDGHVLVHEGGIPTVLYGPGNLEECAHKPDEWVSLDEVQTAARVYLNTLIDLVQ